MRMTAALCALSVSAFASAQNPQAPTTCEDVGATTVVKQATLGLGVPIPIGEPQAFCDFYREGMHSVILATSLLTTKPNLAATAYRTAPMPTMTGTDRPDNAYCESLLGTHKFSNFVANAAWLDLDGNRSSGICVFADGSMISTWTLYYKRRGAKTRPDFEQFIQSPVIPARLW